MTYKAPDDPPMINPKDWSKTMESINEYLRLYLGEQKIPLAYVVRKDDAIVPTTKPDGEYSTVQDEIIAEITRDQSCWTYVKPAQRTRDSRMA